MDCMEIFELLAPLHKDPAAFNEKEAEVLEYIMEEVCQTDAQREWFSMYRWECEKVLRKYKNPIARMNKAIEFLFEGLNRFNQVWVENIEQIIPYLEELRDVGNVRGEDRP